MEIAHLNNRLIFLLAYICNPWKYFDRLKNRLQSGVPRP